MVDEQERAAWYDRHHLALGELTGVRKRPAPAWVRIAQLGGLALFLGLLVLSWMNYDPTVSAESGEGRFPLRFALLGAALACLVLSIVLAERSGSPWTGPRHAWGAPLGWGVRGRVMSLVRTADPADPRQLALALDLARRVSVLSWFLVLYAGAALLMLQLVLGGPDSGPQVLGVVVLLAQVVAFVIAAQQDAEARAFLRRYGQPAAVPVS